MEGLNLIDIPMPGNIEAERAVIGSLLIDPETMEIADEMLRGDEFMSETHRKILTAMREVVDAGQAVDLITVTTRLMNKGEIEEIGGVQRLSELANSVPTTANFTHYVEIVKEKAIHREAIIELRRQLNEAITTNDSSKLVARMQAGADVLADKTVKKADFRQVGEVARECFEDIERSYNNKSDGGTTGIPSGFADLDRMTAGFQKNDLIIVAARPSVGKTAFALNIAQNVGIRTREPVAIFSLEMGSKQLVNRMICSEGRIDASRLRTGHLQEDDWEKITVTLGMIQDAPIYIDDSASLTVTDIRARCRRLKKEKGLGLILIDYLQLISGRGRGENRQQEVSEISRTLKQIARELEVPVIALSQLSRSVEQRQDKRPLLSDLRESGSIEQDADIVAFLYRDDYYDKESEKKNIIEIIISKQRNGPVGTVELAFLKNYNKFLTLDRTQSQTATTTREPTNIQDKRKRGWSN